MQDPTVTVEISLYPLREEYKPPIIDFIDRLWTHTGIEILTNAMSTQLKGPWSVVMGAIQEELSPLMAAEIDRYVVVMKLINGDLDLHEKR